MTEPCISIIIPFVAVNQYVLECLSGCLELEYGNFEVVLLPDEKAELPARLAGDARIRMIVTGKLTIAAKRNIGIKASPKAEYIAFIDSDAYPDKRWLKMAAASFSQRPDAWAVGGPNVCPPEDKAIFIKRVAGNVVKSVLVSGMSAYNFREGSAVNGPRRHLPTCNLIVKRKAVDAVAGFDETYITGEDMKFSWTVLKAGGSIFFSKDVVVYHHPRSIFMPFIKQRLTYGLSVPRMMKENPDINNLFYTVPAFEIIFFVMIACLAAFNRLFFVLLAAATVSFCIAVLYESVRWSAKAGDVAATFAAIVLAQLAPGVGTIASFVKLPIAARSIYKNYEPGGRL